MSGNTTNYSYRGDALRHHESGGSTGTYVWEVGRGLPQVLYNGQYWYLYGQLRLARVNATETVFYHHDYPNSVRAISKYNTVTDKVERLATYNYEVFGKLRTQTGTAPSDNDPLFAGEQKDNETGNSYLRARYYDPGTGRFTTKDPLPSLNPYTYVGNNPVNRTDPTGLSPFFDCDELYRNIEWCVNELSRRVTEQSQGGIDPIWGTPAGHEGAFNDLKTRLDNLLKQWDDQDCGSRTGQSVDAFRDWLNQGWPAAGQEDWWNASQYLSPEEAWWLAAAAAGGAAYYGFGGFGGYHMPWPDPAYEWALP